MRVRGFTLIEMLVVITISAILIAMAVPSFQAIIRSSRISSASNSLLAALDLARSESIRRSANVTFCRSVNADDLANADCSSAAANGFAANDWASGWIVFAKAPGNVANAAVEANDEIIVRQAPMQAGTAERLIIESTAANPQSREFNPRGISMGADTDMFIDHRDTQIAVRSERARCLVLNVVGRPRVVRVVNNACPLE